MSTRFEREVTVHWPDADAAGIIWFGNFFRYLEETEEELFRARGRDRQAVINDLHVFMPRTHIEVGFLSPARLNDRLLITVVPERHSERRLNWRFEMTQAAGGAIVCKGAYRTACVDSRTFAARAFPEEVFTLLQV